jgi:hypothetical protein
MAAGTADVHDLHRGDAGMIGRPISSWQVRAPSALVVTLICRKLAG